MSMPEAVALLTICERSESSSESNKIALFTTEVMTVCR